MATVSLPPDPNLDRLRRRARELQRAVRAGDPAAVEVVRRNGGPPRPDGTFQLSAAQLVVAREHGFPSWPRLRHYFDAVAVHGWRPPADDGGDSSAESPAARFCRLACLTYTEVDGPARWAEARRLLDEQPDLTSDDIWAAAAAGDARAVGRLLEADGTLARRRGGPLGWRPAFYLAYSRVDAPRDDVLEVARRLLAHGADPNEGYLWFGEPTPFTLLTGVFGEGELGAERTPRHPHATPLARLLLEAGADPNDGQTLYNRMFRADDDHLELLLAHGLGRGDGGPWRRLLGDDVVDSPAELLRVQLRWAVEHGQVERVRLLATHGVDLDRPQVEGPRHGWRQADGRTPVERARLAGQDAVADELVAQGAADPDLGPVDRLVGALLRADEPAVLRLLADDPAAATAARAARPSLVVWAAANGWRPAVALLVRHGWDVNAYGRGDVPVEEPSATALHVAAGDGDVELVAQLLELGADPAARDRRFGATPLDWARHLGRTEVEPLLTPP